MKRCDPHSILHFFNIGLYQIHLVYVVITNTNGYAHTAHLSCILDLPTFFKLSILTFLLYHFFMRCDEDEGKKLHSGIDNDYCRSQ